MLNREYMPDFIVVGAEKCGTTWLADMLRQHPQIFIPEQKEIHYFNRKFAEFPELDNYNFDKPLEWYLSFFKHARANQVKGEICPSYLWDEQAARRIYEFNPELKIIILLRSPVERTFSAYRFYVQRGLIRSDFKRALEEYGDYLLVRSRYYPQVKRYLDLFQRQNVLVLFHDELRADSGAFLTSVQQFLGVSIMLPENLNRESYVTGETRFGLVNVFLLKLRLFAHKHRLTFLLDAGRKVGAAKLFERFRQMNKTKVRRTEVSKMEESCRKWLQDHFRDDIQNLAELLNRDLSTWEQ